MSLLGHVQKIQATTLECMRDDQSGVLLESCGGGMVHLERADGHVATRRVAVVGCVCDFQGCSAGFNVAKLMMMNYGFDGDGAPELVLPGHGSCRDTGTPDRR